MQQSLNILFDLCPYSVDYPNGRNKDRQVKSGQSKVREPRYRVGLSSFLLEIHY